MVPGKHDAEYTKPHRFFTLEFIAYFLLVAFGVLYQIPYDLGPMMLLGTAATESGRCVSYWRTTHFAAKELDRMCGEHEKCSSKLRAGLPIFPGRGVDLSDHQWHSFRQSAPLLCIAMAGWAIGRTLLMAVIPRGSVQIKALAYGGLMAVVLFQLHGGHALWPLLIATVNYVIGATLQTSTVLPYVTWAYAMLVLFGVHHWHSSFLFGNISPALSGLDTSGMIRWYTLMNLFVLRMISFNMDRYWALRSSAPPATVGRDRTYKEMEKSNATRGALASPLLYFVYMFYTPLYFAGPIISSNAFMEQFTMSTRRIPFRSVFLYALRMAAVFLLFEWTTHYLYTFGVVYSGAWFEEVLDPYIIVLFAYTAVHIMWLKFLVIWRFFRLWALLDDVECIENMGGCVDTNGSVRGFWTIWHKSFNRWLIRYLYVPLGGNANYGLSVLATFTFTAVWHDLELHLLLWGWMMAIVIVPELYVSRYFSPKRFPTLRRKWYFRHLAALGMVLNTMLIIAINLLGFSVGTGVGNNLFQAFAGRNGLYYLGWTILYLVSGMQWAQEIARIREAH